MNTSASILGKRKNEAHNFIKEENRKKNRKITLNDRLYNINNNKNNANFANLVCRKVQNPTMICRNFNYSCLGKNNNIFTTFLEKKISVTGIFTSYFEKILSDSFSDIFRLTCPYNINSMRVCELNNLYLDENGSVFEISKFEFLEKGQSEIEDNNGKMQNTININPIYIKHIPIITQIACGEWFSMFLSVDGDIYAYGENFTGSLGFDDIRGRTIPTKIENLPNIELIECGKDFTLCKAFNGECYGWGNNSHGQLGNGDPDSFFCMYTVSKTPVKCSKNIPKNVISIKCGNRHSILLTSDGKVFLSGDPCCDMSKYAKAKKGRFATIYNASIINGLPTITRISCGRLHSMCIDDNFGLWVFGDNSYGQLGVKCPTDNNTIIKIENIDNIIDVSYGGYNTLVKTGHGHIYKFGTSGYRIHQEKKSDIDSFQSRYIEIDRPSECNKSCESYVTRILDGQEIIWDTTYIKNKTKSARK